MSIQVEYREPNVDKGDYSSGSLGIVLMLMATATSLWSYLYGDVPQKTRRRWILYRRNKRRYPRLKKKRDEMGVSIRMYTYLPIFEELRYFEKINNLNL